MKKVLSLILAFIMVLSLMPAAAAAQEDKSAAQTLYDLGLFKGTGTNADGIAVNREGVRCGLVSIPQRSMHTPVEVCDLQDIENTAKLMARYVLGN